MATSTGGRTGREPGHGQVGGHIDRAAPDGRPTPDGHEARHGHHARLVHAARRQPARQHRRGGRGRPDDDVGLAEVVGASSATATMLPTGLTARSADETSTVTAMTPAAAVRRRAAVTHAIDVAAEPARVPAHVRCVLLCWSPCRLVRNRSSRTRTGPPGTAQPAGRVTCSHPPTVEDGVTPGQPSRTAAAVTSRSVSTLATAGRARHHEARLNAVCRGGPRRRGGLRDIRARGGPARPMRWILPVAPLGSRLTKTICFGTLNGASCSRRNSRSSASVAPRPSTEHDRRADLLTQLVVGDGEGRRPRRRPGWRRRISSISTGGILSPPGLICSFRRPVRKRYPSSSSSPRRRCGTRRR